MWGIDPEENGKIVTDAVAKLVERAKASEAEIGMAAKQGQSESSGAV